MWPCTLTKTSRIPKFACIICGSVCHLKVASHRTWRGNIMGNSSGGEFILIILIYF